MSSTGAGLYFLLRADLRRIGKTHWAPATYATRDPVELANLHVGIGGDTWSMLVRGQNVTDEEYNADFSPFRGGNLAFRAPPRVWGLELNKTF